MCKAPKKISKEAFISVVSEMKLTIFELISSCLSYTSRP